jgi:hypothetical protein
MPGWRQRANMSTALGRCGRSGIFFPMGGDSMRMA